MRSIWLEPPKKNIAKSQIALDGKTNINLSAYHLAHINTGTGELRIFSRFNMTEVFFSDKKIILNKKYIKKLLENNNFKNYEHAV